MTASQVVPLILGVLSSGVAGALIQQWFSRRNARLYRIPLIERVNRPISPDLRGFALARVQIEDGTERLVRIDNVREYQLTLRNTSPVHLPNAEIQFEFPSQNVEAIAERPVLSRTPPIRLDAKPSDDSKTVFRWRIPEFPSRDSIEFTFYAVDPSSVEYEPALDNVKRVILQKTRGDTERATNVPLRAAAWFLLIAFSVATFFSLYLLGEKSYTWTHPPSFGDKTTLINWGGCSLVVDSHFSQGNAGVRESPYKIDTSILNAGARACFVRFEGQSEPGIQIAPSDSRFAPTRYDFMRPQLSPYVLYFGPDQANNKATVILYRIEER